MCKRQHEHLRDLALFYHLVSNLIYVSFCLIVLIVYCSTGMNVLLKTGEIVLYLASHTDSEATYAWVLSLEPYSGPPPRPPQSRRSASVTPTSGARKSQRVSQNNASSSSSSSVQSFVHPFAKLCWFKRRPPSEIRKIRSETIYMRLRVAPAFFVHADGIVDNDGYLLSHGLYNFDLRGKNEEVIALPVS